jgi:N-acyl-L-homoserine lactone synthetase
MVTVITDRERLSYRDVLNSMHRDRKRVFVDRLGWKVNVVDGQYEIDQFDTPSAVYLVVHDDATDQHLGSVRLLPTTRPHILGSMFPNLCEADVPVGDDVWEITRLCTAPELTNARAVREAISLALTEFALLTGIRRYTLVTHLAYLSQLIAIGWDCEPLGMPAADNEGKMIGALAINITPATLTLLRSQIDMSVPVLRWPAKAAA